MEMIDGERLYERIYEMGELGKREDGGLYCLALTTAEKSALELAGGYMEGGGLAVGYESPTQFNREYKRIFGQTPQRNIARLRNVHSGSR